MKDLPDKEGVYQDQDGRGFTLYRGRWFFLVIGRQATEKDFSKVTDLVPMQPASGNVEPNFKPFRARRRPSNFEEG